MRDAAAELAEKFPDTRFIADYTGGANTMTAALVCAALERDDVELQIVADTHPNLVRVADIGDLMKKGPRQLASSRHKNQGRFVLTDRRSRWGNPHKC